MMRFMGLIEDVSFSPNKSISSYRGPMGLLNKYSKRKSGSFLITMQMGIIIEDQ